MVSLNKYFNLILYLSNKFKIDESHGIKHSIDVLHFTNDIYENEVTKNNYLKNQENIIYTSALLHDMCDKKYIGEEEGFNEINSFLKDNLNNNDIDIIKNIMFTMSYSKVKKNGYPNMGEYELAYHIVREADLLAAYDFDRCIIYKMMKLNSNFEDAYVDALKLFENRVLKQIDDNLYFTEYSKNIAQELHLNSLKRINSWEKILKQNIF